RVVRRLVVVAGRRAGGAGEPVDADVGQQVGAVHGVLGELGRRVGPLLELLHDPGQLPDRGVVDRVRWWGPPSAPRSWGPGSWGARWGAGAGWAGAAGGCPRPWGAARWSGAPWWAGPWSAAPWWAARWWAAPWSGGP